MMTKHSHVQVYAPPQRSALVDVACVLTDRVKTSWPVFHWTKEAWADCRVAEQIFSSGLVLVPSCDTLHMVINSRLRTGQTDWQWNILETHGTLMQLVNTKTKNPLLLCSQRDNSDYIAHYKAERNRLMKDDWMDTVKEFCPAGEGGVSSMCQKLAVRCTWLLVVQIPHCRRDSQVH